MTKEEEEEGLRIGCLVSAIWDLHREGIINDSEEERFSDRLSWQAAARIKKIQGR